MSQHLLTIRQLATYVGVTVRAVRHYHALGLLPEPPRDESGYRRYGADAVVQLTRIKILAEAGVPLAHIETLQQGSDEAFAAAITAIKADIARRIAELRQTQRRLDALQSGNRLFTSEAVADYLDSLRRIGLSEAVIANERDAWILLHALYPMYADTWAARKRVLLTQPDMAALYLRLDAAREWPPEDGRMWELATDILNVFGSHESVPLPGLDDLAANPQVVALITGFGADAFPAWRRLEETIKELTRKQRPSRSDSPRDETPPPAEEHS